MAAKSNAQTAKNLLEAQIDNLNAETELLRANARVSNAQAESMEISNTIYRKEQLVNDDKQELVS